MQGLFNDLWENQDVVSVNHVVDITLQAGCLIDHLFSFIQSSTDYTFRYWSCRCDIFIHSYFFLHFRNP